MKYLPYLILTTQGLSQNIPNYKIEAVIFFLMEILFISPENYFTT